VIYTGIVTLAQQLGCYFTVQALRTSYAIEEAAPSQPKRERFDSSVTTGCRGRDVPESTRDRDDRLGGVFNSPGGHGTRPPSLPVQPQEGGAAAGAAGRTPTGLTDRVYDPRCSRTDDRACKAPARRARSEARSPGHALTRRGLRAESMRRCSPSRSAATLRPMPCVQASPRLRTRLGEKDRSSAPSVSLGLQEPAQVAVMRRAGGAFRSGDGVSPRAALNREGARRQHARQGAGNARYHTQCLAGSYDERLLPALLQLRPSRRPLR
jgi:hypothetical protein